MSEKHSKVMEETSIYLILLNLVSTAAKQLSTTVRRTSCCNHSLHPCRAVICSYPTDADIELFFHQE